MSKLTQQKFGFIFAFWRVPRVVAGAPGQHGHEGGKQVEERVADDHVVVDGYEDRDDEHRDAAACKGEVPALTSSQSPRMPHTHADAPRRWMHRQWSGLSARERETICKDPHRGRDDQRQRGKGVRGQSRADPPLPELEGGVWRQGEEPHSPCRAGMAFHTDTGPWLANWPSDTSRKKMGKPARASIIR